MFDKVAMTKLMPFTIGRLASGDVDLVRDLLAVFRQVFEDEHTYTKELPDQADDAAIQLYTNLGIRKGVLHFDIAVT